MSFPLFCTGRNGAPAERRTSVPPVLPKLEADASSLKGGITAGAKPALLHSSSGLRYGLSSFLVPANSISARLQPAPACPSFLLQSRSAYDAKRFILLPPARCRIRAPDHGSIAAVFDYHRPISGCAVIPMTPNLHLQEASNGTDHLQLFIIINIIYAV